MNYLSRGERLRSRLPELGAQALLVSHGANVRFLSGFTGSAGLWMVTGAECALITDFRYREQASAQLGELGQIVIAPSNPWGAAANWLRERGLTSCAFESDHVTVAAWHDWQKELAGIEAIESRALVEGLRRAKDDDEMAVIAQAVAIADEVFALALERIRPGVAEIEVARFIEAAIKERGGEGTSFETIVASGARGALPHGVASDKTIEKGDLVTIDMGARWGGYCSDMTRTVCVGPSSPRQREIYELVHRAQSAAGAALRPGLTGVEADATARRIIEEAGYGQEFGHGLGHGVGLDIHEAPRLSKTSTATLTAGDVVTCEPGIYIAGWGGVRIEDMLLVTATGAQILTGSPKPAHLLELP